MRDVRISEQLAYRLMKFLSMYRYDVENLLNCRDEEERTRYLEAMQYGDCLDAKRLEEELRKAMMR